VAVQNLDRLIYGVVLPIAVLVVGLIAVMSIDSRAAAAEFAALAVLFMLVIAVPVTLLVNLAVMTSNAKTRGQYFTRGMIVPALVLIFAIVYQSGLWNMLT